MTNRYQNSTDLCNRALKSIPLASQTFSKSMLNFPVGAAPLFLERGKGAYVWDVDGNRYIDALCALLCVSLGYLDPDVDEAVREQMTSGVSFSLPHRLEMEVAERLIELIPCADMVRFGKNGTDATSAAIRLSRAVTGRDHVAVCGYHGWQDWYIGSTARDLGVPKAVKALTHSFTYNDLSSLEAVFDAHSQAVAAVILEPISATPPAPGFLEGVQALCRKHSAVLVFDEVITGFRVHLGGAQSFYGVTPDLACFGKGMANGYPISAIVGRRDLMMRMEDIFFSGTFGGETVSLAAAKATIDKMRKEPVLDTIHKNGAALMQALSGIIADNDAPDWLNVMGHPAWSVLQVKDSANTPMLELKTFILQEMFKRGVLYLGTHNLSFAHGPEEIEAIIAAYKDIIPRLLELDRAKAVTGALDAGTIQPVFKVRA